MAFSIIQLGGEIYIGSAWLGMGSNYGVAEESNRYVMLFCSSVQAEVGLLVSQR